MFTYKRSDRELLVYLIGNASTNGGDASRVGAFFSSLASVRVLSLPKLMQYLLPRHLGIALRGGHPGMTEHGADTLERHAALQHKGGKGVARHVHNLSKSNGK